MTRPGTAITERPCSIACSAVMSVPEVSPASTQRVPRQSPEMMRLRIGKVWRSAARPNGYSETTAPPPATMRRASSRFSGG